MVCSVGLVRVTREMRVERAAPEYRIQNGKSQNGSSYPWRLINKADSIDHFIQLLLSNRDFDLIVSSTRETSSVEKDRVKFSRMFSPGWNFTRDKIFKRYVRELRNCHKLFNVNDYVSIYVLGKNYAEKLTEPMSVESVVSWLDTLVWLSRLTGQINWRAWQCSS